MHAATTRRILNDMYSVSFSEKLFDNTNNKERVCGEEVRTGGGGNGAHYFMVWQVNQTECPGKTIQG